MKHVTIALEEATLREARRIAAERSTTLNGLIRYFLERLTLRESQARRARCFLGTNILVYAVSSAEADAAKSTKARDLVQQAICAPARPRLSCVV